MCKKNNCTIHKWGVAPIVTNNLYELPEPIAVVSIATPKKMPAKREIPLPLLLSSNREKSIRWFKRGRLLYLDEESNQFIFTGHKIPNSDCKKSNKKYVFAVSF